MASSVKYLKRMLSIDSIGTHEYGRAKNNNTHKRS